MGFPLPSLWLVSKPEDVKQNKTKQNRKQSENDQKEPERITWSKSYFSITPLFPHLENKD